jgi:hypothetical protein
MGHVVALYVTQPRISPSHIGPTALEERLSTLPETVPENVELVVAS